MSARRFIGYRPKVPAHYITGGYGNAPDEAQFEGVQFTDGTVAVRWLTQYRSTSIWPSFAEFQAVHGHAEYETRIDWLDATPARCEHDQLECSICDIRDLRTPASSDTPKPCERCGGSGELIGPAHDNEGQPHPVVYVCPLCRGSGKATTEG